MHAHLLLKRNIDSLLKARNQTRHDLAMWCRRTDPWLSKILDPNGKRGLPLKYLDRIADFFGISAYQLLQPGISPLMERRKGDRRSGVDRRLSHAQRVLRDPSADTQELVRLVLSASDDDRKALYQQLVLSRNGAPNTAAGGAGQGQDARNAPASRRSHR